MIDLTQLKVNFDIEYQKLLNSDRKENWTEMVAESIRHQRHQEALLNLQRLQELQEHQQTTGQVYKLSFIRGSDNTVRRTLIFYLHFGLLWFSEGQARSVDQFEMRVSIDEGPSDIKYYPTRDQLFMKNGKMHEFPQGWHDRLWSDIVRYCDDLVGKHMCNLLEGDTETVTPTDS